MGITLVLSDITTMLKNTEALHPVVSEHREAEKETKGWDRIPPTAQQVVLEERVANGTLIPT